MTIQIVVIIYVVLIIITLFNLKSRYIKVPKDKLMVIYGKVNEPNESGTQIVKSGSMFVWPIIQKHVFLDTTTRKARLKENFTTKDDKSILIKGSITYRIPREGKLAVIASGRLLGKTKADIEWLAVEYTKDQFINFFANLSLDEIKAISALSDRLLPVANEKLHVLGLDVSSLDLNTF